jgi:ubiquinone/menaquinone biosynthesis C-methylase UbiE
MTRPDRLRTAEIDASRAEHSGSNERVVRANIEVHSRLAADYEATEPHFRPENRAKVRRNLLEVADRAGTARLLDIGCGTGFVIGLIGDTFSEIHGIDPTPAMLERVDLARGNITLHEGVAETLPFNDGYFDVVTAYSVLHHLADHRPALAEAARVLHPGGVFYVDLEPNRAFWRALATVEEVHADRLTELDEIVSREIQAVLHVEDGIFVQFAIEPDVFRAAEHIKSTFGGFDPAEFEAEAVAAGFTSCRVTHEWFVGQGAVMHGRSPDDTATIEAHLRRLLPLSAPLFKYLRFEATR